MVKHIPDATQQVQRGNVQRRGVEAGPGVILHCSKNLALGPVRFDTATDRSVQGSLRVAKQDLEVWLYRVSNVMDLDPLAAAVWLNERPATVYGKPVWPQRASVERVESL